MAKRLRDLRLVAIVCLLLPAPALACDTNSLSERIDASLPRSADKSFDASEAQSTDGGSWDVYFGPDRKTPRAIRRTDFGESGKTEIRMAIVSAKAYAVAKTQFVYSVPYAVPGSMTIRKTTDIYLYCDGKLVTPADAGSGDPAYAKAAAEVMSAFETKEIEPYVRALARK